MPNENSIFYKLGEAVKAQIAAANGASGAVQTELDTTQTGAGLAADGTYSANVSTNYLTTALSLKAADEVLDTQLKSANDAILTKASQTALNTTNTSLSTAEGNITSLQTGKADLSGANFVGDVSVSTNLTVSGNLQVLGEQTVTKINQTDLDISDNFIGLNRGASVAANNAKDIGLYFERGSAESAGAIVFDETNDKFVVGFLEGAVTDVLELGFTGGMDGTESTIVDSTLNLAVDAEAKTALANVVEVAQVSGSWGNSTDYEGTTVPADAIHMVIDSTGLTVYFSAGSSVNFLDLSSTPIVLKKEGDLDFNGTASFSSISFVDQSDSSAYTHVSTSVSNMELSMDQSGSASVSTSGAPAGDASADTASATAAPLQVGSLEIGSDALGDLADFNAGLVA